ncbi:hypothetical protein PybrP1_006433 [[Pythium] brassicae (nom. inval.)]|nr:hypothetical protein PybrP1_006433 [[Pythium] brassicae (nom. inval.)]
MATANMYALSLRSDGRAPEKAHEDGVPFFVPQLAKVKTNIMCQTNNKHLLFSYEKAAGAEGALDGPLSPTTSALPYRKQGSQAHYTDDNLRKRQKLMDDRRVLAGIARFWDTFPVIRQGQTAIERCDFVDVFMKFYKALVAPHEFSIGEARKIVERDWGRDVGGSDAMSKTLADEYSSFLCKLFERVTMKVQDQKSSLWVTVFAEIDKIRSFAEPKETNLDPGEVVAMEAAAASNQEQDPKLLLSNSVQAFTSGMAYIPAASISSASSTASFVSPSMTAPTKSRPPLMKKKTLPSASEDVLSPDSATTAPALGGKGSLRRLPDIPLSQLAPPHDATTLEDAGARVDPLFSTESPDKVGNRSGRQKLTTEPAANGTVVESSAIRSSRFQRGGSLKGDLRGPSELSPQPIRLAMPSIYLSPDLGESQAVNRAAARRRIRESSKFSQRLRRITF